MCTEWDSEKFFGEMGKLLHKARRWTGVKITDAKVEKVLEQPGPELLGYATTHLRLVTNASAKASILFLKYRYSLEITDDLWVAPQLERHPIERQWLNAQTNTGFKQLDQLLDSWNNQFSAMVLKQESVVRVKDLVEEEEFTKTEKIEIIRIEALDPTEVPDDTFGQNYQHQDGQGYCHSYGVWIW